MMKLKTVMDNAIAGYSNGNGLDRKDACAAWMSLPHDMTLAGNQCRGRSNVFSNNERAQGNSCNDDNRSK